MQRWRASRAAQATCGVTRRFGNRRRRASGSSVDRRLLGQHIDAGAAEPPCLERGGRAPPPSIRRAARGVDQQCIGLHQRKFARADQAAGRGVERAVQGNDVRRRQAARRGPRGPAAAAPPRRLATITRMPKASAMRAAPRPELAPADHAEHAALQFADGIARAPCAARRAPRSRPRTRRE